MGINRIIKKGLCKRNAIPFSALQQIQRLNRARDKQIASGEDPPPVKTKELAEKVDAEYFKKKGGQP